MDELEARPTQTKVKHEILQRYIERWGYIVNSGLKRQFTRAAQTGWNMKMRYVYVDCFASSGRYATEPDIDGEVYGSPVIGIQGLDTIKKNAQVVTGFSPTVTAILIERETRKFERLLETLEIAGYGERVCKDCDLVSLQDNQIAVINADYRENLDELLDFTKQQYTWSFYLLDPYGPSGIPLEVVASIISQERHDVMINLIYQDLHKKAGSAAKEIEAHEKHLAYYDKMYGSENWRETARKYFDELTDKRRTEMENELVDLYRETLRAQDNDLAVKTIRLKFSEIERTMLYLFLTTHDATGALSLNEILDEAELREQELREEHRNRKIGYKQLKLDLFAIEDESSGEEQVDLGDLADYIHNSCRGEELEFRHILRRVSDTPYYLSDVRKSMTLLKRRGHATFESPLQNRTIVSFS